MLSNECPQALLTGTCSWLEMTCLIGVAQTLHLWFMWLSIIHRSAGVLMTLILKKEANAQQLDPIHYQIWNYMGSRWINLFEKLGYKQVLWTELTESVSINEAELVFWKTAVNIPEMPDICRWSDCVVFPLQPEDVSSVCSQRGVCSCDWGHRAEEASEAMLRLSGDKESQRCLVSI